MRRIVSKRHSRTIAGLMASVGLFAAGLAGCAQPKTVAVQGGRQITTDGNDAAGYRYPATAPVLNAEELKRFVAQNDGKVVVVEFWASWSSSSRQQIARLAELHEKHRSEGLRVVACSFDEPREWRSHTVPILEAADANYPCVVIPAGARQSLADWLDPAWRFDVPARFVIDRTGTVVARVHGDEPVLAALDLSSSYRTRTASSRDRSTPTRSRELRVATASTREPIDEPTIDAEETPRRTSTTRSDTSHRGETTRTHSTRYRSASRTTPRTDDNEERRTSVYPSVGPASTRVKLINIATGESEWLPVVSRTEGLQSAMDGVVAAIQSRVPRSTNARFAVLPLSSMRSRDAATPLGREAAKSIVAGLRREGYYDLVEPTRASADMRRAGLTPTQIDYDGTALRGKISADYLVMGWVRNDVDDVIRSRNEPVATYDRTRTSRRRVTTTTATKDSKSSAPAKETSSREAIAGDAGAGDTGYVSPRREAEDFGGYE